MISIMLVNWLQGADDYWIVKASTAFLGEAEIPENFLNIPWNPSLVLIHLPSHSIVVGLVCPC